MKKILLVVFLALISLPMTACSIAGDIDTNVSEGDDYQQLVNIARQVTLPELPFSSTTGDKYTYSDIIIRFRGYNSTTGEKTYTITIWQLNPDSVWNKFWNSSQQNDHKYDIMIGQSSNGRLAFNFYYYTVAEIKTSFQTQNIKWIGADSW